ncbi:MAG TPA: HD-GYP domain-containing protein, partial [Actinomycetota bacterium]|nr:HD-GYP domain-containing protein [Actinomycetota bacterium]
MRTDAPITEEAVNATPRASLAASITATAAVAIAPAFIAFSFFVFRRTDPHLLVAILVAIPLTILAVMAASRVWATQPGSAGVPLGDLMLWSRIRRRNSRRTIDAALNVLGSDRRGNPTGTGVDDPGVRVRAMRAIAEALDAMSSYTLGHSRRVERHARKLARALDLDEVETESVALAATLHDVGNVTIPDHLLHKAGPLSAEERAVVESHVVAGRELIARSVPADVAQAILHHHECWDGSGYPDSLSGLEIPLFARMIAVAEAYDAMTSTRPYRQGLGRAGAIDALTAASGTQFDPDIVDAFITTLRRPFFEPSSPLLAAFATQIREAALGLRRIGAVALSATASTIVLALVVGSTAITPPVSERPVVAAPDRGSQRDLVLGDRVTNDP